MKIALTNLSEIKYFDFEKILIFLIFVANYPKFRYSLTNFEHYRPKHMYFTERRVSGE